MNENINLCEILEGLEGIELYSSIFGAVTVTHVWKNFLEVKNIHDCYQQYNKNGKWTNIEDAECTIFPSKDQQDWSKFERPIKKGTPMMCRLKEGDWILRYYAGIINGQHKVYRRDKTISDGFQNDMIPFDKFDPNNIEESLKYNIQK